MSRTIALVSLALTISPAIAEDIKLKFDEKFIVQPLKAARSQFVVKDEALYVLTDKDLVIIQDGIRNPEFQAVMSVGKINAEITNDEELASALVTVWQDHRRKDRENPLVFSDLEKRMGSLVKVKFTSTPSEATLRINGVVKGKTACAVYLSKMDKYSIECMSKGFKTYKEEEYTPPDKSGAYPEIKFVKD